LSELRAIDSLMTARRDDNVGLAVRDQAGRQSEESGLWLIYSPCKELRSAIALERESLSIGRHLENDVPLRADAAVSRGHARLERRGDAVFVVDEGSTNGTWVDGERVREARLLSGCVLRVGNSVFRFAAKDLAAHSDDLVTRLECILAGLGRSELKLSVDVIAGLARYELRDDARELTRIMRMAIAQVQGTTLLPEHLPSGVLSKDEDECEPYTPSEPTATVRPPRGGARRSLEQH
jgi:hypothetical protein